MFKHVQLKQRCYASYTFDRLQFRTEAKAAVHGRGRQRVVVVATEIHEFFPNLKRQIFVWRLCWSVLVLTQNIAVARYYNSILSCYLVIRVGK